MPKQYQSYIRNNWPLPFIQPWLYGPTKLAKKPFKYNFILCTRYLKQSGWHYYADDLTSLGQSMDLYLADKNHLEIFSKQAEIERKANHDFSERVKKIKIVELANSEISALLKQWYFIHSKFCAAFMPIDATDQTLEEDISNALKKSKINLNLDELACLLTPNAKSYVQKENQEFCAILKKQSILKTRQFEKLLDKFISKWWWTSMGWGQYEPLTAKSVARKISQIKNCLSYISQAEKKERTRQQLLKRKKIILRKLPKEPKALLAAFEVLAKMHDDRKEIQIRMMTAGFKITEEILKRSKISDQFRDYISITEYQKLLLGKKLPIKLLQSRQKYFWCQAVIGGKLTLLSGNSALKKLNQSNIYRQDLLAEKMIKGQPASPGKVRGVVRVGLEPKSLIAKFKHNEILVTGMTTPDFVPAMRKALAVITDEGGITCHAAIISRELKLPCITGSNNATKILKTGDLVEVDADKGVIKII